MDQLLNMAMAKRMAYTISAAFLAIHVVMICLFVRCGVVPMACFNVFSLAFYLFTFFMVHKQWLRIYSALVYLEVVAHMSLAVLLTGWGNGFQIAFLGMNVLLFFAEYMGHSLQIKHVHALPWCIGGMCVYLVVFVATWSSPVPYTLPDEVSFWLQIGWGIIVFVISIVVLKVFVLTTFSSENALTNRLEHDRLTGLPNREHLAHYLDGVMEDEGLSGYWAAMADLDDFKLINDTYGHNCGDAVLRELADVLRENAAGFEMCRWGGEEFVLVGRFGDDEQQLRSQLDRLRRAIEGRSFWYDERRLGITVSIGAARYREGETTIEWINEADKRLYEAKALGKNRIAV